MTTRIRSSLAVPHILFARKISAFNGTSLTLRSNKIFSGHLGWNWAGLRTHQCDRGALQPQFGWGNGPQFLRMLAEVREDALLLFFPALRD